MHDDSRSRSLYVLCAGGGFCADADCDANLVELACWRRSDERSPSFDGVALRGHVAGAS